MRIGIFGGTFNPPHIGHTKAAKNAATENNLDLLIVIPTGMPPHKKIPDSTPSPQTRLHMTQNAFCDVRNCVVMDFEVFSSDYNYTIDAVNRIRQNYPYAELFLLVGADMFNTLDCWKDSSSLLKLVAPICLSRDKIPISSSKIRKMLPLRKGRKFLSDSNYAYIIKHRLYNAMPQWKWLRERAHLMLAPSRIPHVDACESEAVCLARCWGVSVDDAREAAILHDITKKLDFSENMCIISKHRFSIDMIGFHEEKLLHAVTGAIIAKSEFGVSDVVAEAIKWHTTGKAKMSMLEKVIYIADYIESTRDFPGVKNLRRVAYKNIDDAMIIGLKMSIDELIARGITPNVSTYEALSDLCK